LAFIQPQEYCNSQEKNGYSEHPECRKRKDEQAQVGEQVDLFLKRRLTPNALA
jgi:hypothetical protein